MYLCCFYVKYLHLAKYFNKSEYDRPLQKKKKNTFNKSHLYTAKIEQKLHLKWLLFVMLLEGRICIYTTTG